MVRFCIHSCLLFIAVFPAMANALEYGGWDGGVYLGLGQLEQDTADENGVGTTMQMGGALISVNTQAIDENQNFLALHVGTGVISMSDEDDFTQTISNNAGDVRNRSSSVSGFEIWGETGYNYVFSEKSYASLNLGFSHLSADRAINQCTDCKKESLSFDASSYISLGLNVNVYEAVLKLGYRNYVSGDVVNALNIQLVW